VAALSDDAQFERAIGQLLDAPGPEEARHLLRDFPRLTSEEVYAKLTKMIAQERHGGKLLVMTCLMSCRGLLHRCQQAADIDEALASQASWPLRNQGPLNRLLALPGSAAADERIRWAQLAADDIDPKEEPDFRGLVDYHLGWVHQIKADEGLVEALGPAIAHFEAAEGAWRWEGSLFGKEWLGKVQSEIGRLYLQRRDADRSQDVEMAIDWLQKARNTYDTKASKQLDVAMLLGQAYLNRTQEERLRNIEQGIAYYDVALSLAKERDIEERLLGLVEHSLAVAYRLRPESPGTSYDEQARELAEQALERFDRQTFPADWARTAVELATIYARPDNTKQRESVERGIELAERALGLVDPQNHPHLWTLAKLNLGNLYCDRISGSRAENNRHAIRCFRDILRQCDKKANPLRWAEAMNNLGTVYASRQVDRCGRNYRMAAECFTQALEVRQPESLPHLARQTAANLGDLHFGRGNWPEARDSLATAIHASDLLYQAAATPEARQAELREMRHLPARLAYALSKVPAEEGVDPLLKAVLALEQNRARWLSETLSLYEGKPKNVPQDTWKTFTAGRERIQALLTEARLPDDSPGKREYLIISEEMAAAYAVLEEAVNDIRKYDDAFMPNPGFDQIKEAIVGKTQALIYFAVTPAGTIALIVREASLQAVPCPLTIGALENQVQIWFGAYDAHKRALSAYVQAERKLDEQELSLEERTERLHVPGQVLGAARDSWHGSIESITGWLWKELMGPVVGALSNHKVERAALIAQSWLGLLPLHAAWTQMGNRRRYALDDITFTYAPNARALAAANETAKHVPADELFAVDEPEPVTASPLPNSTDEIAAVCKHFAQRTTLGGLMATHQAILKSFPNCPVLHFSCHGQARFSRPLEGGLVLADNKTLTLRDILSLRLEKARLAVLSACETGVPGIDLPDEVVSLPTGLAQAGVAGVIGSLWSVSDLSTMVLMARFYELWRQEGMSPPEALQQAQKWLRDTPNGEKTTYLEQSPDGSQATEDASIYGVNARHRRNLLKHPKAHGFEHPFHWAAFTYTGA
jgi:CHAT domain-containing protein